MPYAYDNKLIYYAQDNSFDSLMPSVTKKLVVMAVLTSITIVSIFLLSYITYAYLGVSGAIRTIDVSVQNVNFTVVNSTLAYTRTFLKISNPSEFTFLLWQTQLYLQLNVTVIGLGNPSRHSIEVLPFSNTTLPEMLMKVTDPQKVSLLARTGAKDWHLKIRVRLYSHQLFEENIRLEFSKKISTE